MLSERIQSLKSSTSAIMTGHLICSKDPFSADNKQGYLNFGIAENHLMDDYLLPFINQPNNLESEDLQYFDLSGLEGLRQNSAQFFERYFNLPNLKAQNLVFMNGLSSVCECLSYSLFNSGDLLMMPTPYYSGFEFDFKKRFEVNFINVHLKEKNSFRHNIADFEQAYDECANKDRIKALIITHPHNPTGEVVSEQFLKDIIIFAKNRKLEIITDEIYALTNMQGNKHKSLLSYAGDYKSHVHFLYGLAKDFTLAGMKVGIYYCEDDEAAEAMKLLAYFHCTSSLTQRFSERLLGDFEFIDSFLKENNKRLLETKSLIINSLPKLKYIDGDSGLFFLIDLRYLLAENTFAEEEKLFFRLLDEHRIFLTAGKDLGMKDPGFFRLCFSKKSTVVEELIQRLVKIV